MIRTVDPVSGKKVVVRFQHLINYNFGKPKSEEIVDRKTPGKTVCKIYVDGVEETIGYGEAVQSKHDLQFNRKVGVRIAFERALSHAKKYGELTNKSTRQRLWQEFFEMRGGKF